MPEWVITIIIAFFSGLVWLTYQHPVESRKLIYFLLGLFMFAGLLWMAYVTGENKEHSRIVSSGIHPLPDTIDTDTPFLFIIISQLAGVTLLALSLYFESLKKKPTK